MSKISDFKSAPIDLYKTSSDASIATMVGSRFATGDGREFMLVQIGGTAIASGKVVQGPAAQAAAVGLSPATTSTTGYSAALGPIAGVIGGKTIQIATAGTAVLVNRFAGGYMNVVEGTGLGQTMKVESNTAASTTSAMGIVLEDAFSVATSTDSRFSFTINPYGSKNGTDYTTDGVVVSPTTLSGVVLGVAIYPLPATTATVLSYGFIQTKGLCAVSAGATVALGLDVGVPDDTAGQVLTYAVATGSRIGTVVVASADAKHNMINLQL